MGLNHIQPSRVVHRLYLYMVKTKEENNRDNSPVYRNWPWSVEKNLSPQRHFVLDFEVSFLKWWNSRDNNMLFM